jgi:hypothetical protein
VKAVFGLPLFESMRWCWRIEAHFVSAILAGVHTV